MSPRVSRREGEWAKRRRGAPSIGRAKNSARTVDFDFLYHLSAPVLSRARGRGIAHDHADPKALRATIVQCLPTRTQRLKTGAIQPKMLTIPSARRVFRPTDDG